VLKTHVDAQARHVWADVLIPDGTVRVIDVMWLRNTTVENGNLEESDDPEVTILGEQHI
jgi:transglutaminase/protease-like cytokinesis protein 3